MKTNVPVFAQTPKVMLGILTAAIGSIGTNNPTGLVQLGTVGPDGAILTSVAGLPLGTVTASSLMLYASADAGATKYPLDSAVLAAYTNSTTAKRPKTVFSDVDEDTPIRLPANAIVYGGLEVAQGAGVALKVEYSDF